MEPVQRDVAYRGFRTAADFATGTFLGTELSGSGVILTDPVEQVGHTDAGTGITGTYDLATWTSPPVTPGFTATEVIPSWTADTPGNSWIQVDLRGTTDTGTTTRWYTLARWAADDTVIRRASVPGQADANGSVAADTLTTASGCGVTDWQLRVTLLRPSGTTLTPTLRSVGAAASGPACTVSTPSAVTAPGAVTGQAAPGTSAAGTGSRTARGLTLDVPAFSQRTHAGHYPQWGGGGEAWCSPTSTSMVLAYWGVGPVPEDYAWVDRGDPRPMVDHAARQCFDYAYQGAGNWPFNTAYAGRYGLDTFVTRLRSLAEAESFIASGVPLIVSASYRRGEIPGLDYDTRGHLLVLVGFTAAGDPVLNDPYSPTDQTVRKPVDRNRFEAAWQGASGGLVYVIRPETVPLPAPPAQANW
ncbi:C39 family peptidase [Micromonospora sonneratiae]|uniref:C39 family peptidase n=1 Tax=Micromonospora sonneratiae TaxID=1184706 RepID=A0ABW3Y5Z5_9ACTN